MDKSNDSVPDSNLAAYRKIFLIETGLRELIIKVLSAAKGARWHCTCLNPKALADFKAAKEYERKTPWVRLVPHHPIYYIDFPEIKAIIERNDNWEGQFKNIFKNKEAVAGTLKEIEPIRNHVAHSRRISSADLGILTAALGKISAAVNSTSFGPFNDLSATPTIEPGLEEWVKALSVEMSNIQKVMLSTGILSSNRISIDRWWFTSDYFGYDIAPIEQFVEVAANYASLRRSRGDGYKIQRWLVEVAAMDVYKAADAVIQRLIEKK